MTVRKGAVRKGAVQKGAVEKGAVRKGAVQNGAVQNGILFELPRDWSFPDPDTLELVAPAWGPHVRVAIRVEKIYVSAAKKVPALQTVQATIASIYPAYEVRSLLERPLAMGACVEAELRPRSGSQLPPARFYAVVLSRHLVLFDYRRAETAAHLDPIVCRIVHGIREDGISERVAKNFASERRGETRLFRRALEQWQVFLCHNSKDKDQVRELRDRLFDEGIVCWFDEQEIGSGTRFVPKIEQGLSHVDAVIVALGGSGSGLGDWQELEYGVALNEYVRRNRAGARALKIIPVALPDAPRLAKWTGFLGTFNGIEFGANLDTGTIKKLVQEIVPGA